MSPIDYSRDVCKLVEKKIANGLMLKCFFGEKVCSQFLFKLNRDNESTTCMF